MFCPNYKNKEVFDGFNEIVEALGGAPLTEEEFRDSTLRNQRTGSDYSAMESAYKIYHLNNGNLIYLAPNGNNSILFLSLLSKFNGDRTKAIVAKSIVYSQAFRKWFGDWAGQILNLSEDLVQQLNLVYARIPELLKIGTVQDYARYISLIFPNSVDKNIYWHGTDEDLSDGFNTAKRGKGSGAPETQSRNDFYLARQAWSTLQYVSGVNRKIVDKNGFAHWNKLWWELKEIMSNGRRENNDWKDLVINETNVRQAIPNKRGVFNRDIGGGNGKWLSERKADYGYENKTDREFFEEVLGIKWGKDTFNTWVQRNAEIFKQLESSQKGIYPAIINTTNPIRESGLNTYYEEQRGLFTQAEKEGNDAILGENTDNEFGSDVAVVINASNNNVHFLGTKSDIESFRNWINKNSVSKVVDSNGEPLILFVIESHKANIQKHNLAIGEKGARQFEMSAEQRKNSLITDTMFDDVAEEDLIFVQDVSSDIALFSKADFSSTFGEDIWQRLLSGEQVSSQELFEYGIADRGVFHGNLFGMAKVLSKHDIPVMVAENLSDGIVATTMTDEYGNSVIMINPLWINEISKQRLGEVLIHEIIHAITANALNAPKTATERVFKDKTYKIFNTLKNAVKNENWHIFDVYGGLYALCDAHEFVSEFISNSNARSNLYALAQEIDLKNNGNAVQKLKNFVNALFKLFVNKNLFKTTEEKLSLYEKYLQNYLNGHNTIKNTRKYSRLELILAYKNIDDRLINNDKINIQKEIIHKGMVSFQKHNVRLGWSIDDVNEKEIPAKDRYDWIKNSLLSRINAIQTSRLPLDTKTILMSETKGWLDLMNNPQVSYYESFSQLLNALGPRIIDSLDLLDKMRLSDHVDAAEYNYQMHDNIGGFDAILKDISTILNNDVEVNDIVAQFNELNQDDPITAKNISELQTAVEELSGLLSSAKGVLSNLLSRVAVTSISHVVNNVGSVEGAEMIQNMVSRNPVIEQDVSWFLVYFGQADASPNEIVRAVSHLIQKTNDVVDDRVLDKAIRLIQLQHALKDNESVLDLYETVNGKRTGFIVREFNHGKYLNDRAEFMKKINKKFGLPPKNNTPPSDEAEAILWEMERQEFLSKHCEQRYIPEYYQAWAKVPRHVKELIGKLNGAMIAILQKYNAIDADGTRHYEKITSEDDWNLFLSLRMSKKLMRETHDRFGNEKQGTDLQDALTLREVYKLLYGDQYVLMKTKKAKWEEARNKIIEQCGGQEELDKRLRGEDNNFDFETFDKWESRNTKYDFKRLSNGKPIIFDDFEQDMLGAKLDYGEEYRKLQERERALLRTVYDPAGEPNPDLIPDSVKNIINNEIHPRMKAIRELVIKSTPGYARLAEAQKKLFDAYFEFVDTRYYRKILGDIMDELDEEGFGYDENMYAMYLSEYGHLFDYEGVFFTVPYKWYQVLRAKDKDYMEAVPNEAWLELDDDRSYDNPVWKELQLDRFGLSVVPKMSLYKNEQYQKIQNSPTLKALYDEIIKTMHESNEMLTNRQFTNDYLLPGVSGKLFDRLKLVKGLDKLWVFLKWAGEKLGINVGQDQDVLLRNDTTAHDENNEEGDVIYSQFTRTVGRRADGREYTALPQYFTRRLDNPEFTSGALLDIVLSYYKMSVNYSEKSKIKDQCDAILDYVKSRKYNTGLSLGTINGVKKFLNTRGADSTEMTNVYKQLKNVIDFGLYGKATILFKTKWFDFNKIVDVTKRLTTATNLGMNKKVAAVGFMTAMHAHIVQGLLGKEYNFTSVVESGIEVVKHLAYNWMNHGIYSRKSGDLLQVIMEEFGIASQLERKMTDLDFSDSRIGELRRMVKQNYVFGYLSTIDYLTKSQISLSVLKNYKYIDGKIYSSLDIEYMKHDKEAYSELYKKYKKAKSIYNYMKVKNGRVYFEDAGMNAAWKHDYGRIKAKCVKLSERADGVATGLQRAAILNSWIGMFIMIHRLFLPLMLQERYGDRVYDYDTLEYKNGLARTMFKYLGELMMNSFSFGAPTTIIALSFWISNLDWCIYLGLLLSGSIRIYGKTKGLNSSLSEINKKWFNTHDDQKSSIRSTENKYAIKQIIIERALVTLMSHLLINPVCKWADDDKDDFWLLTFAYWLKGSKWEINGPYNIEEIVANIKSPTAATSLLDRINAVSTNSNSGILSWLSTLSLTDEEKVINNNSPYAGWTRALRSLFKMFTGPVQNEFEQDKAVGVYGKRKWLERLNFHEHKGDNKDTYEETRNLFNNAFN